MKQQRKVSIQKATKSSSAEDSAEVEGTGAGTGGSTGAEWIEMVGDGGIDGDGGLARMISSRRWLKMTLMFVAISHFFFGKSARLKLS